MCYQDANSSESSKAPPSGWHLYAGIPKAMFVIVTEDIMFLLSVVGYHWGFAESQTLVYVLISFIISGKNMFITTLSG